MKTDFIRIARSFEASAERVFDAWVDPRKASKWLFTSPTSETNGTVMDARVGGKWTITDRTLGRTMWDSASISKSTGRAVWFSLSACRNSRRNSIRSLGSSHLGFSASVGVMRSGRPKSPSS